MKKLLSENFILNICLPDQSQPLILPSGNRLKMKRGTVVSRLYITIDMDDENYLPEHVVVMGGELDNLHTLKDIHIDL